MRIRNYILLVFVVGVIQAGDDRIYGGDGNDTIIDTSGNNIIQGGDGDDQIYCSTISKVGTGNNEIEGGAGNDLMLGGNGNDTFIIQQC